MLVSLLGHIVFHRISPSQPFISIILSFWSSLVLVAIALFVVCEFKNTVYTRRIKANKVD
jgi:hypothetical protein